MTQYLIRNNSARPIGVNGKIITPLAGVVITKDMKVHPGTTIDPFFPLNDVEMFRSFRGIMASMKTRMRNGEMELDVLADGVEPKLTVDQLQRAMDEYRDKLGHKKPKKPEEHTEELERTMNRPEDPMEKAARVELERRDQTIIKTMAAANREMVSTLVAELFEKKFAELAAEPEAPKGDAPKPTATAPTPPAPQNRR